MQYQYWISILFSTAAVNGLCQHVLPIAVSQSSGAAKVQGRKLAALRLQRTQGDLELCLQSRRSRSEDKQQGGHWNQLVQNNLKVMQATQHAKLRMSAPLSSFTQHYAFFVPQSGLLLFLSGHAALMRQLRIFRNLTNMNAQPTQPF